MARVYIREKQLKGDKVSLILDYYENGERRKKTLQLYVNPADKKSRNPIQRNAYDETYQKALLLKNQEEQRLIRRDHDLPTVYDKRASYLDYFDKLAATRNDNWRSVRKHLRAFSKGSLAFGNVTEEWIARFQDYLRGRMQDVTVNTQMGIITTSLNQAVREKLIPTNPSQNVQKVRGKEKAPRYLTKEQIELLAANREGLPDWFVDPFLFSCQTGLRLSDVEGLEWGNLQCTGKTKEGLEQLTIIKTQVKTQEEVTVPVSRRAAEILERQRCRFQGTPDPKERVFALKSRTQTKRYIHRWRALTGLNFTYHSSRHTFGTGLQSAGVDINTTSKLMGHKSLGMTLRYAKVVDKTRNEAIDKMAAYWG